VLGFLPAVGYSVGNLFKQEVISSIKCLIQACEKQKQEQLSREIKAKLMLRAPV